MEDFLYYNSLYDLYGSLLTEKETTAFQNYYQEDLSLGEIAEIKGVSRSAVAKTIKTVLDKLNYYEDKLHLYQKNNLLADSLQLVDILEIKKRIEKVLSM